MTNHFSHHKNNEWRLVAVILGTPLLLLLVVAVAIEVDAYLSPICGAVYP